MKNVNKIAILLTINQLVMASSFAVNNRLLIKELKIPNRAVVMTKVNETYCRYEGRQYFLFEKICMAGLTMVCDNNGEWKSTEWGFEK